MAYGIQRDDGEFLRKPEDAIRESVLTHARRELGPDIDLSQGSPIRQLLDVVIFEHDIIQQTLEDVYYTGFYADAYGVALDKLLSIAMVERLPRRGATCEVTFRVNTARGSDIVIPEGTRVSTQPAEGRPAIPYKTTEPATLEAGQIRVTGVLVRALEPWETDLDVQWLGRQTNVAAYTISRIDTPVQGVASDGVSNPYPAGSGSPETNYIRGRNRETDAEYRERYEASLGEAGTATLAALVANVRTVSGIETVDIEENVTMDDNTATGGLPPKSFRIITYGEYDNDDVADSIFDTRPAGIESYGSAAGLTIGTDGVIRREYFDEATEIPIYVNVQVTADTSYPDDGNRIVEDAIVRYIGGTTVGGTEHDGLAMGNDVYFDELYRDVMNAHPAVYRADLAIGTDAGTAPASTDDLVIGEHEVTVTTPDNVTVSETVVDRQ